MKVAVLASGSSGNCVFVGTNKTRVLIDCGICRRELTSRLLDIDEDLTAIDAILLTHEHSDHVSGLASVAGKMNIPVYGTTGTLAALTAGKFLTVPLAGFPSVGTCIAGLMIDPFAVPHDGAEPVGYHITDGLERVTVAIDLGHIPIHVGEYFSRSSVIVTEANHDIDMLEAGPYSASVKVRIASDIGHVSNDAVAECVREWFTGTTRRIVLMHLSQMCNRVQLVRVAVSKALRERGLSPELEIIP